MLTYVAALGFGLLISIPTGLLMRRLIGPGDQKGAEIIKKVLSGFYVRLLIDGAALFAAYLIFRDAIPLLLTATGLLAGMVWSIWPLARPRKEGNTQ